MTTPEVGRVIEAADVSPEEARVPVPQDVEAIVAAWIRAFNDADLRAVLPFCRPDVIVHAPAPAVDVPNGIDRITMLLRMYRGAFPLGVFAAERIEHAAPLVSCDWTARGVNLGSFLQFPVTHRDVLVRGTCRLRFVDGLVAELWFNFSLHDVLDQLDVLLPAPGRTAASADAAIRRAFTACVDALSGGAKAFDVAFDADLVVHAQGFGMQLVARGRESLDRVVGLVQSVAGDVQVSIRECIGQGRTATYRASLTGRAGGADPPVWPFDCMLRADGQRVVEIWMRIGERA